MSCPNNIIEKIEKAQDSYYEKNSKNMNLIPEDRFDRKIAIRQVPALIKGYLRLGGVVGENASVDYAFNTTDVCLVMDISVMNGRQKRIYGSIS